MARRQRTSSQTPWRLWLVPAAPRTRCLFVQLHSTLTRFWPHHPSFFVAAESSQFLLHAEFEADAKAKVEELSVLLNEREEEFYSYQNSAPAADNDDYDDEDDDADDTMTKPKPPVDSIDYADDEDDEDEGKDEM